MKAAVLNISLYKIGWLSSVASAAGGQAWIGGLVVLAVVAAHLATATDRSQSVKLLMAAAVIGFFWESLLVAFGVLGYPGHQSVAPFAPYWIIGMWVLFATTLNIGFRFLKHRLTLATLVGAIGGPLAFLAGSKVGAVEFMLPTWQALAVIGIGWAMLLPAVVWISRHFDGHAPSHTDAPLVASTISQGGRE